MRILAWLTGALLLAIASAVVLGIHLNERSAAKAAELCAQFSTGMREDAALAIAQHTAARHFAGTERHEFRFQGWIFNATSCQIVVASGKVTSARVVRLAD